MPNNLYAPEKEPAMPLEIRAKLIRACVLQKQLQNS